MPTFELVKQKLDTCCVKQLAAIHYEASFSQQKLQQSHKHCWLASDSKIIGKSAIILVTA